MSASFRENGINLLKTKAWHGKILYVIFGSIEFDWLEERDERTKGVEIALAEL